MRRQLYKKVAACLLGITGMGLLQGTFAQPSQAQAVQPNTTFGCSIPGADRRDDPFGAGIEPANALIATPSFTTPVPTQANLAYFSTVGTMTGQARCLMVQARLKQLNAPANYPTLIGYTFGLGRSVAGDPVICFRPIGGSCAYVTDPLAFGGAPLPALSSVEGYLVMTLAHGDTPPDQALNRLNTNLRSFAVTSPGTPNIDDSNLD
jgi:hypothetical protein